MPAAQFADAGHRESWIRDKNMVVFQLHSDRHPETQIDLFVSEPFDFNAEHDRALVGELMPPRNAAWREHDLSQLRYFRALSLRARMEAVQGMADVIRRFEQMRREGKLPSR